MREHKFVATAWAPYADLELLTGDGDVRDAELDWVRRRDALSAAWVLHRAQLDHTSAVLRVHSHAHQYRHDHSSFSGYAAQATIVTNRSRNECRGATLAPWCDANTAAGTMQCADGSSVLLHEHPTFPLMGWAMALGAVNLRTLRPTPDTRSDEQREQIEDLIFSTYNGWRAEPGRNAARYALPRLERSGMTWAIFVGSVLAIDPRACDLLEIEKVAPRAWRQEIRDRSDRITRLR